MKKLLTYDPSALDIARAIVAIVSPDDAFLFGSRARGDWTDQSDIDVLTIAEQRHDTRVKYQQALQTGKAMAIEIYGRPVKIDLVRYSLRDFEYYSQARTHLTHSALQEGINMSGEATGYGNQYPDAEPNNWPDIEERFTNYQRQILAAENNLEAGLGYEEVGFHFQRSLENAMKGFLSYMDYGDDENAWMHRHSVSELQEVVRTFPEGQARSRSKRLHVPERLRNRNPIRGGPRPPARRGGSSAEHHENRRKHDAVHSNETLARISPDTNHQDHAPDPTRH